ncbi:MAG: DNA polymerase III subunit delta [Nitratireductor sp.]|nr:DNA polymerase III subunit delta [Nitratireductor sp.]
MAEIKASQAEQFVSKPDTRFRTFLVYGPDSGMVSERADLLAKGFGIDLEDPFSLVRMDADNAAADKASIADEAHTIGMFGGSRLIRISGTTRRNLTDALQAVLDHPPSDCWIILEAGDLKREAALRKAVEKSSSGVAIPCYADNDAALDRLIQNELAAHDLKIDNDARLALRSQLGADRMASRNEITKLALYCHGQQTVRLEDVMAVVGDVAAFQGDDLIDAAATGNLARLEELLRRLPDAGLAPDMLILACLRHFQTLQFIRHQMDSQKKPIQAVLGSIRPPLHFSRKDATSSALAKWSGELIQRAITRLDQAQFQCRANAQLGLSLAGTALLALALEASRRR